MIWHMTYEYIWNMISHIIYDISYIISYHIRHGFCCFNKIEHFSLNTSVHRFFLGERQRRSQQNLLVQLFKPPSTGHHGLITDRNRSMLEHGGILLGKHRKFLGISSGNGQKVRNQQDMIRVCHGLPENGDLPTSFWQF